LETVEKALKRLNQDLVITSETKFCVCCKKNKATYKIRCLKKDEPSLCLACMLKIPKDIFKSENN